MTVSEIQSKIETIEKSLASPAMPENMKERLRSKKEELDTLINAIKADEKKLATAEKELAQAKPAEKKEAQKEVKVAEKKVTQAKDKAKKITMSIADILKKAPVSQTAGRSKDDIARDAKRKAMRPGKRLSEEGKTYYESRPNRSDVGTTKYYLEHGGTTGENLAPNGKPSNLTPELWREVRTPEFKAWFGDWQKNPSNASRVIDENGEPRVVNYSSNELFDKFDKTKFKEGRLGKGAYFYDENGNLYNKYEYTAFLNIRKQYEDGTLHGTTTMAIRPDQIKIISVSDKNKHEVFTEGHLYAAFEHKGKKHYVEIAGFDKEDAKKAIAKHFAIDENSVSFVSEKEVVENMPKGIYVHTKKDKGFYKYGGTTPIHFGMGHNINVLGYATKNFDVCYNASKIFSELSLKESTEKEEKDIALAARNLDDFFEKEKFAVNFGSATEADFKTAVDYLLFAQAYLIKSNNTVILDFAPPHLLEIAKRLELETITVEEVEEEVEEPVLETKEIPEKEKLSYYVHYELPSEYIKSTLIEFGFPEDLWGYKIGAIRKKMFDFVSENDEMYSKTGLDSLIKEAAEAVLQPPANSEEMQHFENGGIIENKVLAPEYYHFFKTPENPKATIFELHTYETLKKYAKKYFSTMSQEEHHLLALQFGEKAVAKMKEWDVYNRQEFLKHFGIKMQLADLIKDDYSMISGCNKFPENVQKKLANIFEEKIQYESAMYLHNSMLPKPKRVRDYKKGGTTEEQMYMEQGGTVQGAREKLYHLYVKYLKLRSSLKNDMNKNRPIYAKMDEVVKEYLALRPLLSADEPMTSAMENRFYEIKKEQTKLGNELEEIDEKIKKSNSYPAEIVKKRDGIEDKFFQNEAELTELEKPGQKFSHKPSPQEIQEEAIESEKTKNNKLPAKTKSAKGKPAIKKITANTLLKNKPKK